MLKFCEIILVVIPGQSLVCYDITNHVRHAPAATSHHARHRISSTAVLGVCKNKGVAHFLEPHLYFCFTEP